MYNFRYLRQTGRDAHQLRRTEQYLKANRLFLDYAESDNNKKTQPNYTKAKYFHRITNFHKIEKKISNQVLELDLASIVPCVSGPKRPHDQIPLSCLCEEFKSGLTVEKKIFFE